ncbi:MAPEG family [Favolaschia claudopus]|uniref:MAPEG family n=1 Tax=Favolaschia claudopus TaxID=2862362 RepID=A0AAW0CTM0_9AGAR
MSYTISLTLPPGSSYVAAATLSTLYVLIFQIRTVIKLRTKAGIKYPRLYADEKQMAENPNALAFNCAQRAHQNTLEYLPILYTSTLLTALKYPIPAACALGVWSVSRIAYTIGYSSGNPGKRQNAISVLHYPMAFGLLGAATYTVAQLVLAEIRA